MSGEWSSGGGVRSSAPRALVYWPHQSIAAGGANVLAMHIPGGRVLWDGSQRGASFATHTRGGHDLLPRLRPPWCSDLTCVSNRSANRLMPSSPGASPRPPRSPWRGPGPLHVDGTSVAISLNVRSSSAFSLSAPTVRGRSLVGEPPHRAARALPPASRGAAAVPRPSSRRSPARPAGRRRGRRAAR